MPGIVNKIYIDSRFKTFDSKSYSNFKKRLKRTTWYLTTMELSLLTLHYLEAGILLMKTVTNYTYVCRR